MFRDSERRDGASRPLPMCLDKTVFHISADSSVLLAHPQGPEISAAVGPQ